MLKFVCNHVMTVKFQIFFLKYFVTKKTKPQLGFSIVVPSDRRRDFQFCVRVCVLESLSCIEGHNTMHTLKVIYRKCSAFPFLFQREKQRSKKKSIYFYKRNKKFITHFTFFFSPPLSYFSISFCHSFFSLSHPQQYPTPHVHKLKKQLNFSLSISLSLFLSLLHHPQQYSPSSVIFSHILHTKETSHSLHIPCHFFLSLSLFLSLPSPLNPKSQLSLQLLHQN